MIKFFKKLKQNNIICFISNSPKDRTKYLDTKFGFIDLFDFGFFSFQAHSWKPEKEIYEKFLKRFHLNPKQLVYIDDQEKIYCLLKNLE